MNKQLKDNPLRDKEDLQRCLKDLLSPLPAHATGGGYDLGSAAAHYAPKTALMEGWSRTLWGIGPLISGGGAYADTELCLSIMREGTDPQSPHFWGTYGDRDQRMVEMAAIALTLIIAKKAFWEDLDAITQDHLYRWLSGIQSRELPANNWHFFRILVCCAFRELGLPVNKQAETESFNIIENCYQGDGWYSDGEGGAYDLYNPMGFHYYGLVYARLAGGRDYERAARYIERAILFAPRFARWFRDNGSIIPYGRSLTYRFAAHSFFSACAFTGIEAVPWDMMKRIVLQGFRYWFSRPILDNGGILSVGYGYPNLIMADHYNSPGSPYWGLKAFLILALERDHAFWQAVETPLPEHPEMRPEKVPGFIITRTAGDIQLLNAARMPLFEMNHAAQKYGKFAYSARFGFCVSLGGTGLERAGGDSMLLLSDTGAEPDEVNGSEGTEHWRSRLAMSDRHSGPNWLSGVWRPWPDVRIYTLLISLGLWHLRIHHIASARNLKTAEGSFAIKRYHEFDEAVPLALSSSNTAKTHTEALAVFPWGASRIAALEPLSKRTGTLIVSAPNLNVLEPSCVIPTLMGNIEKGRSVLVTAISASDANEVIEALLPQVTLGEDRVEIVGENSKQIIYF